MLYAVADAVVDHYLDVATELGTDLEELEAEVFTPDGAAPGTPPPGSTTSSGRSWSSGGRPGRWRRRWPDWRAWARTGPGCRSWRTGRGPSSVTCTTI
ncbi:hypothetical protein SHKM778_65250 [Streptomyces sp. KM77-8]|uniref:Uncharacterized protein n=1 Tax=Streptomyces haneummycinicus TaxID=3074435 RepID=A0AAT9HRP8_9ACTN